MQDRYRGGGGGGGRQGGGGGGGGGRYGGGGRRRRGRGGRPHEIYPDVALEPEEHIPWSEDFEREPNPDAEPLHLAYDSVYTHEGDIREELLESWVEASSAGKRWRCWNCGRNTQRFTQLRLPTLRTVVSICDNCATWTVWDAWRDLANPRIFSFRRTIEETEPATHEPGASAAPVPPAVRSNGSGSNETPAVASAPSAASSPAASAPAAPSAPVDDKPTPAEPQPQSVAIPQPGLPGLTGSLPVTPEPSLQPVEGSPTEAAAEAAAKPKRARAPRAKAASTDTIATGATAAEPAGEAEPAKPKRAPRPRAKVASAEPAASE